MDITRKEYRELLREVLGAEHPYKIAQRTWSKVLR